MTCKINLSASNPPPSPAVKRAEFTDSHFITVLVLTIVAVETIAYARYSFDTPWLRKTFIEGGTFEYSHLIMSSMALPITMWALQKMWSHLPSKPQDATTSTTHTPAPQDATTSTTHTPAPQDATTSTTHTPAPQDATTSTTLGPLSKAQDATTSAVTIATKSEYTYVIDVQELAIIKELINSTADDSPLALLGKRKKLENKGELISHIHPLLFWKTILSDKELSEKVKKIKNNKDKNLPDFIYKPLKGVGFEIKKSIWKTFKFRYALRFEKQQNTQPFTQKDIDDFCTTLKLKNEDKNLFKSKKWEDLIETLTLTSDLNQS